MAQFSSGSGCSSCGMSCKNVCVNATQTQYSLNPSCNGTFSNRSMGFSITDEQLIGVPECSSTVNVFPDNCYNAEAPIRRIAFHTYLRQVVPRPGVLEQCGNSKFNLVISHCGVLDFDRVHSLASLSS